MQERQHAGANVDFAKKVQKKNENALLIAAAARGQVSVVKKMINVGADHEKKRTARFGGRFHKGNEILSALFAPNRCRRVM